MFLTRTAKLDDWPAIKAFYEAFLKTDFSQRLDVDLETLEGWFIRNIALPEMYGMVLCLEEGTYLIAGIAFLLTTNRPYKLIFLKTTFIHGIYMDPHFPRASGRAMNEGMKDWGREREHDYLQGNVRLPHDFAEKRNGFKLNAVSKRYGFEPIHVMIGQQILPKEVSSNG